jgi:hypothetical protein
VTVLTSLAQRRQAMQRRIDEHLAAARRSHGGRPPQRLDTVERAIARAQRAFASVLGRHFIDVAPPSWTGNDGRFAACLDCRRGLARKDVAIARLTTIPDACPWCARPGLRSAERDAQALHGLAREEVGAADHGRRLDPAVAHVAP